MIITTKWAATVAIFAVLTACGGGGGGGDGGGGGSGGGGGGSSTLTASGQITDSTSAAVISGAQVDINLASTDHPGNSGTDGNYSIAFPNNALPRFLVGSVNKAGYLPGTVFFDYIDGQLQPSSAGSNNAALVPLQLPQPSSKDVVFLNGTGITHLGDDEFTGEPNSKLQVAATGKVLSDSFELTSALKDLYTSITITMQARGVQTPLFCDKIVVGNRFDNEIVTGGTSQDLMSSASDGSFTQISHTFPLVDFAAGDTVYLQILAGKKCVNPTADVDDLEIATITGELQI